MNIRRSNSLIVGKFVVVKKRAVDENNQIWNIDFLNTRGIPTKHLCKAELKTTTEYEFLLRLEEEPVLFERFIHPMRHA